jgi:hypothetical protein
MQVDVAKCAVATSNAFLSVEISLAKWLNRVLWIVSFLNVLVKMDIEA